MHFRAIATVLLLNGLLGLQAAADNESSGTELPASPATASYTPPVENSIWKLLISNYRAVDVHATPESQATLVTLSPITVLHLYHKPLLCFESFSGDRPDDLPPFVHDHIESRPGEHTILVKVVSESEEMKKVLLRQLKDHFKETRDVTDDNLDRILLKPWPIKEITIGFVSRFAPSAMIGGGANRELDGVAGPIEIPVNFTDEEYSQFLEVYNAGDLKARFDIYYIGMEKAQAESSENVYILRNDVLTSLPSVYANPVDSEMLYSDIEQVAQELVLQKQKSITADSQEILRHLADNQVDSVLTKFFTPASWKPITELGEDSPLRLALAKYLEPIKDSIREINEEFGEKEQSETNDTATSSKSNVGFSIPLLKTGSLSGGASSEYKNEIKKLLASKSGVKGSIDASRSVLAFTDVKVTALRHASAAMTGSEASSVTIRGANRLVRSKEAAVPVSFTLDVATNALAALDADMDHKERQIHQLQQENKYKDGVIESKFNSFRDELQALNDAIRTINEEAAALAEQTRALAKEKAERERIAKETEEWNQHGRLGFTAQDNVKVYVIINGERRHIADGSTKDAFLRGHADFYKNHPDLKVIQTNPYLHLLPEGAPISNLNKKNNYRSPVVFGFL